MKLSKAGSLMSRITEGGTLGATVRKGYREGLAGVKHKFAWLWAGIPGAIYPKNYATVPSRPVNFPSLY